MPPGLSRYCLALIFFQGFIFVLLYRRQLVPCISFYSLFMDAILISVTSFPGIRVPYSQLSRGHRTQLCRKHNRRPKRVQQGCAKCIDIPCFNYKREALSEHARAAYHIDAVQIEAQLGLTAVHDGIETSFTEVISAQRK